VLQDPHHFQQRKHSPPHFCRKGAGYHPIRQSVKGVGEIQLSFDPMVTKMMRSASSFYVGSTYIRLWDVEGMQGLALRVVVIEWCYSQWWIGPEMYRGDRMCWLW